MADSENVVSGPDSDTGFGQEKRVCLVCQRPTIEPGTDRDTAVCRRCELRRQATEKPFPSEVTDPERASIFIAGSGWRLASTMLDVPHQYTVRDLSSRDARKTTALGHGAFEWFVAHIRKEGVVKRWGPYNNTYLTVGEWEYWSMGHPVSETTIVNRQAAGPVAAALMASLVEQARASGRGEGSLRH